MKQSNQDLLTQDPQDLDIENVREGGQVIEMDLGLGVFDTLPADAVDSDADAIETLRFPGQGEAETTGVDLFFRPEQSSSDEYSSAEEDQEIDTPPKKLIEEL